MDFKKAFDSVWYDGLFYRLLDYGIGGNIYKLIRSLYSKSSCAVRLNRSKTDSFSYGRGVRQGCILSPLLFYLFMNELPSSFDYTKTDPIPLPNNTELNTLSYPDDLVLISRCRYGLENCLKTLESFTAKWLIDVNMKKTKIIVFQKSGRRPKNLFFSFKRNEIEIVQEYTYLGIEITASGSFTVAQNLLAEKAINALFKIRKQINFSTLPFSSAQKIFETAIEPILTYGSEVWGVFLKLDFEKWDETSTEKAHLRF